jgi:hypothetical protein
VVVASLLNRQDVEFGFTLEDGQADQEAMGRPLVLGGDDAALRASNPRYPPTLAMLQTRFAEPLGCQVPPHSVATRQTITGLSLAVSRPVFSACFRSCSGGGTCGYAVARPFVAGSA